MNSDLKVRRFVLSDSDLGIVDREIVQLHYTGWPDHDVPTLDSFKPMFEMFMTMLLSSDPSEKAIVHCSAGIGRTGTTIALSHIFA